MKLELVLDEVDLPWSPAPEWTSGLEALLAATSAADCVLQVVITDDETLQEHNREYRGLDRPTDVLSFPDGDLLPSGRILQGEVVISLDAARRQAEELGHDELRELSELTLHGVLHLVGYDHERDHGEMDDIELQLREELFL